MRRRLAVVALGVACLAGAGALPAAAHGIGGRTDLPVPLTFFLTGGAVVLVLSFAALASLWPEPRLQEPPDLRPLSVPGFGLVTGLLGVLGVLGLVIVIAAGIVGADNATTNPASVLVWVVFWLIVPFLSAVLGNLYRFVNPWRTVARWLRIGDVERADAVPGGGMWLAAGLFFAFTWFELVLPQSGEPRTVAAGAIVYSVAVLFSIDRLGRATTSSTVDAFAVYNRLFAGMAPLTTTGDGRPAYRGWLRGLPQVEEIPGLGTFLVVMIGTVTFDGLSATPWYADTFGTFGQSMIGGTIMMVLTVAVIGVGYAWASRAAANTAGGEWTTREVAQRFAHTLVPIAFAYAFAHYFTLVVFEGQLLISTLSDPLGTGLDLFGTAGRRIDYTLLSPTAVWYVQLAAIVLGHIAAVVLAHDRALADFPKRVAVRTQYAMLVLMVVLTGIGLSILAAG